MATSIENIEKLFEGESSSSDAEVCEEELEFIKSLFTPIVSHQTQIMEAMSPAKRTAPVPFYGSHITLTELYSIGIEEKYNVGTSAPLTVTIALDPRLNREEIMVADANVPLHRQTPVQNIRYFLLVKIFGESTSGEKVTLTMSRCEKCKQRMKSKNKDEPDSDRFVDILTSKLQQTRKKEGASRDAVQVHFRCTPVKCHKLKSFVTMEFVLVDLMGSVVSKPNQCTKMHFRTADKKVKPEPEGDNNSKAPLVLPVNIPTSTDALHKQIDNLFRDLQTRNDIMDEQMITKLYHLQQLVNFSLRKNEELDKELKRLSLIPSPDLIESKGKRKAIDSESKRSCKFIKS